MVFSICAGSAVASDPFANSNETMDLKEDCWFTPLQESHWTMIRVTLSDFKFTSTVCT